MTTDLTMVQLRLRGAYADGTPMQGYVTAEANNVKRLVYDNGSSPKLYLATKYTADFGAVTEGEAILHVPASDSPNMNPQGFTYKITEYTGNNLRLFPAVTYNIEVTADDAVAGIDLARATVVSPSQGSVQWTKGLVAHGTGAPSPTLGVNSDFYIDISTYEIYGPKTDAGWGSPTAMFTGDATLAAITALKDEASGYVDELTQLAPYTDFIAKGELDGLLSWRAAYANRRTARADVVVISEFEGQGTTGNAVDNRWLRRLELQLRAESPGGGGYYPACFKDGSLTDPATRVGTLSEDTTNGHGLGGKIVYLGSGDSITYPAQNLTGLKVWYKRVSVFNGTATVRVDGAIVGTITAASGATIDGLSQSYSLVSGTHTVQIANEGGAGSFFPLIGVELFDGDSASGVHVFDSTSDTKWAGLVGSTWTTAGHTWDAITAVNPSLVVLMLGMKDWEDAGLAFVDPNVSATLDQIHTVLPEASILIVAPPRPLYNPPKTVSVWTNYVEQLRQEALNRTYAAYIDLQENWPTIVAGAGQNLGLMSTTTEPIKWPSNSGHEYLASILGEALIGAPQPVGSALTTATRSAVAGVTTQFGYVATYGHSYTQLGVDNLNYLWTRALGSAFGARIYERGVSGACLATSSATQGGIATILQNEIPTYGTSITYQERPPMQGAVAMTIGLNDVADTKTNTGANLTECLATWLHNLRSALSAFQGSVMWEESDGSFPGTFGGSGTWSTFVGTAANSGTGFKKNTSSGATITINVPSGWTGGVLALRFVTSRSDSDTLAAGPITFTVDGTTAHPIGYPSTFNTAGANYYTYGGVSGFGAGSMVARFNLAAGAHTIVATAGTGGMSFDALLAEATSPRPVWLANIAHTPLDSTSRAAAIDAFNAATVSLVTAEFPDSVIVGDMNNLLWGSTSSKNFYDGTHPNALGHQKIANLAQKDLRNWLSSTTSYAGGGRSPLVYDINGMTPNANGSLTVNLPNLYTSTEKPSDTIRNNTNTRTADPDLVLSVTAGTKYRLDGVLFLQASTTADAVISWSVPSGTSGLWTCYDLNLSAATQMVVGNFGLNGTATVGGAGVSASSPVVIRSGVITITTSGTIALTWAQNTAEATDCTLKGGSWIRLEAIGTGTFSPTGGDLDGGTL